MHDNFPPLVFSEKFDIHRSHVIYSPGLLFICGGETDVSKEPPISVRDYVLRRISEKKEVFSRIILAEEMQSWLQAGAFQNLVLFEKALAHLADKIVVFVESPGSIAELGAFSFLEDIYGKLLIFISSDYKESNSFITLGPIKKLINNNDQSVKFYEWSYKGSTKISSDLNKIPDLVDFIVSDIECAISKQDIKKEFKVDKVEHILLFICDLLCLFPALQMTEIHDICYINGLKLEISDLKGYLFILTRTHLLKEIQHGETYFMVNDRYLDTKFIKYAQRGDHKIHDRSRIKVDMIEYLRKSKDPKDKKRFKLITGKTS